MKWYWVVEGVLGLDWTGLDWTGLDGMGWDGIGWFFRSVEGYV
jgi:hypothetical protein